MNIQILLQFLQNYKKEEEMNYIQRFYFSERFSDNQCFISKNTYYIPNISVSVSAGWYRYIQLKTRKDSIIEATHLHKNWIYLLTQGLPSNLIPGPLRFRFLGFSKECVRQRQLLFFGRFLNQDFSFPFHLSGISKYGPNWPSVHKSCFALFHTTDINHQRPPLQLTMAPQLD